MEPMRLEYLFLTSHGNRREVFDTLRTGYFMVSDAGFRIKKQHKLTSWDYQILSMDDGIWQL